ncbi:MAG: NAD-dependent epimerase/dehydratase family protein [Candidatus Dormibacteria bacterium]
MASIGPIVVTGGAGFIGANLCRALSQSGMEVVALDDLSTGSAANLDGANVRLVEGTILDAEVLVRLCRTARCVVHLAARPSVPRSLEDPIASNEVNVTGTLRVLEATRAAGAHIIVASSSSVYGSNPRMPKRESLVPSPVSPYAVSKLAAESYALSYLRCFSLPVLVLRFFNVFGPLQRSDHAYAAVVPRFIDAALRSAPLEVHGDGRQTRDFTYVGSVVRVLVEAIDRRVVHDGPVNLAYGSRITILDLVQTLETVLHHGVDAHHIAARAGDVRHSQADQTLLRSLFPAIEPTDFREGLATTVEWFRTVSSEPPVQLAH